MEADPGGSEEAITDADLRHRVAVAAEGAQNEIPAHPAGVAWRAAWPVSAT